MHKFIPAGIFCLIPLTWWLWGFWVSTVELGQALTASLNPISSFYCHWCCPKVRQRPAWKTSFGREGHWRQKNPLSREQLNVAGWLQMTPREELWGQRAKAGNTWSISLDKRGYPALGARADHGSTHREMWGSQCIPMPCTGATGAPSLLLQIPFSTLRCFCGF